MDTMSVVESAYRYTDPQDYQIKDVFWIIKSQYPGQQYLEKASKSLRLQSTLLLLNDELPFKPEWIIELAGRTKTGAGFKVSDFSRWDRFVQALAKICDMEEATLIKKIRNLCKRHPDLPDRLRELCKEPDLPFSDENCAYCSQQLGIDLKDAELINTDIYKQLVFFRELLDHFSEVLTREQIPAADAVQHDPLTLFSALVSNNLPAFRKLLKSGKEDPGQSIGNQPLLFYALNVSLVKHNLKFFIYLAEKLKQLPAFIRGQSILDAIAMFKDKRDNIRQAFEICLQHHVSFNYEDWYQRLAGKDWHQYKENYQVLAECQQDFAFEEFIRAGTDPFLEFIGKAAKLGTDRAMIVAAFINPKLKEALDETHLQKFLENIRPSKASDWSIEIFQKLVECGFFDNEIFLLHEGWSSISEKLHERRSSISEKIATFLCSGELRGSEKTYNSSSELSHWVTELANYPDKSIYAEVLWIILEKTRDNINDKIKDIKQVLNILAKEKNEELFLSFAKKAFSSIINIKRRPYGSLPLNEIAAAIPYEYFQKLLQEGLIDSQQLDDKTIAKHISSMPCEDFIKLVKGNSNIGNSCLNAAAEAGKIDILEYLLEERRLPVTGVKKRNRRDRADVLVKAAQSGQVKTLNFLLERNRDLLDTRDDDGMLPIHRAAEIRRSAGVTIESLSECLTKLSGKTVTEGKTEYKYINAPSSKGTPLVIAASQENMDVCAILLKLGADINAAALCKEGAALLQTSENEVLQFLLENDADVNVVDQEGKTVFNKFEFSSMNLALFEALLKKAKPKIVAAFDVEGRNVLHKLAENASFFDEYDERKAMEKLAMRLVKDYNVDINAICIDNSRGGTPFMLAAENGDLFMMKLLVELGAQPAKSDAYGRTALFSAVASRSCELAIIKYLVEKLELDVNICDDNGQNCLFYALDNGKQEIFNYLVARGADVRVRDKEGQNLLWQALNVHNYTAFIELIEHHKLDVKTPGNDGNIIFALLDSMLDRSQDQSGEIFRKLLKLCLQHGADINGLNSNADNILKYAIENSTPMMCDIIQQLLSVPDLQCPAKDPEGNNWLHWVAGTVVDHDNDLVKLAEFLITEKGIPVSEANNNGDWPLHLAAEKGNIPLCQVLYDQNPQSIYAKNNEGESPLVKLIQSPKNAQNLDAIKKFVDVYCADVTIEDQNQNTLLDIYLKSAGDNVSVEGIHFLCDKGLQCNHLSNFANKKVELFQAYATLVYGKNKNALLERIQKAATSDDDVVINILQAGNLELFQYLIDQGFNISQHFERMDEHPSVVKTLFDKLEINDNSDSWLRLFFVNWQWPVADYLKAGSEYYTYFMDTLFNQFKASYLPVLKLLLDELKVLEMPGQEILDSIMREKTGNESWRPETINSAVLSYLASKGAKLTEHTAWALLWNFDSQEMFADMLDYLVEAVDKENVPIKIKYSKTDEFDTTLLHAAAGNDRNIFALRYLIEKHGYQPENSRDGHGLTVLESAAKAGNLNAVHYLLSRDENITQEAVDNTLLNAVQGEDSHRRLGPLGRLRHLKRFGRLRRTRFFEIVQLLVEAYHANPKAKDIFGRTAIDYADDATQIYLKRKAATWV